MKKDRRAYQKYDLKNGITVFYLPMDVEIGQAIINIPFGHQNNINNIPLGGFHFLEHCVLNRSEKFPEFESFGTFVGKEGGYKNGGTTWTETYFEIEVPSSVFMESFEGILSHIYNPVFVQEDIDGEKEIIINERKKKGPYFPGTTEGGKYFLTEVIYNKPFSLEQIFGDDETISKMDIDLMKKLHQYYFTDRTTVFIGGTVPINECLSILEKIQTTKIVLPKKYDELDIVNGTYHEKSFFETHRYEYALFYLLKNKTSYLDFKSGQILFNALLNNYTGKIYKWLRNEIGVYEISKINTCVEDRVILGLEVPLSSYQKVSIIREEMDKRIVAALSDDTQIVDYIESQRRGDVFSFQTLDSRLTSIFNTYRDYGFPITDSITEETFSIIEKPGYLLDFYLKMKEEGVFGEFLAKPIE